MKAKVLPIIAVAFAAALGGQTVHAQTMVVEETLYLDEQVPCDTHYYSTATENWFLQLGAGADLPLVEKSLLKGDPKYHFTAVYNLGFGKWCSPYVGWRMSFLGGKLRWDNNYRTTANWVNANLDFMWDMFNTFGGVNSGRPFSIVPFIGLGGAYSWDYSPANSTNIVRNNGKLKTNSWSLPLSAGLQLRLRLSQYVDFFAEGRAQFVGDNFNNYVYGSPVDMNISVIGGFSFNLGGAGFNAYNPCNDNARIRELNGTVNDLRAALAVTAAQLAEAEAQLPCPEVPQVITTETIVKAAAPMMTTVRFTIDSSVISQQEMINVYNVAQWMKENPDVQVTVAGYADAGTGTSKYNLELSKRRAEAVRNALINDYGINADRITMKAEGSAVQPYEKNDWNRIVIFTNIP